MCVCVLQVSRRGEETTASNTRNTEGGRPERERANLLLWQGKIDHATHTQMARKATAAARSITTVTPTPAAAMDQYTLEGKDSRAEERVGTGSAAHARPALERRAGVLFTQHTATVAHMMLLPLHHVFTTHMVIL